MTPRSITGLLALCIAVTAAVSCGSPSTPSAPSVEAGSPMDTIAAVRDDAGLFRLVTPNDPQNAFTLFPNAEPFTTGRLNGSEAHQPVIRVLLNNVAAGALVDGRLARGAPFPDGAIIVKEIRSTATASPNLYTVMMKNSRSALAGNGWLWAEYRPSGSVVYSVESRGGACTSCHLRENGSGNDLVRTFERQR